jgi:peptidyl-prolyl cis-trans isomerase SurA
MRKPFLFVLDQLKTFFKRCRGKYILIYSLLMGFLVFSQGSYGLTVDRVLASVNGEIITLADYKKAVTILGEVSYGEDRNTIDEALLRKLIEDKLIVQEAKRRGFDAGDDEIDKMTEEFKSQNGMSQEDLERYLRDASIEIGDYRAMLKEQILSSKLVVTDVDSKIIIRDEEVEEYFISNRIEFEESPERVEVKAIFLRLREGASLTEITDLKRRALKVSGLLKKGRNFAEIVQEYSDEPLKSQEGFLGIFTQGTLIPPLDRTAFSMQQGAISEPIWVSEGVYILYLEKRTSARFKSFDEARKDIIDTLSVRKRSKLFNEWIKALWEKSSVIINQG